MFSLLFRLKYMVSKLKMKIRQNIYWLDMVFESLQNHHYRLYLPKGLMHIPQSNISSRTDWHLTFKSAILLKLPQMNKIHKINKEVLKRGYAYKINVRDEIVV